MSNNKKLEAIYVELDVLLDTRMGTIARMDQEAAVRTLTAGYHKRDVDVFAGIDMETYKELYSQRDTLTLAHSSVTNMLASLTQLSELLMDQAIARPYHDGGKIVVNTYPYQLSDEESDQLGKAVAAWMRGLAPVELTHIPPERLTPLHCKQNYAMMIVYEFESWLNLHVEEFKQVRIPEILMLAPAIYFNKKPSEEELAQAIKEAAHPMRALEMLASPLVELRLIDAKYFSLISNK